MKYSFNNIFIASVFVFILLVVSACQRSATQETVSTENKKPEEAKNVVSEPSINEDAYKTVSDFCEKLTKQDVKAAEGYFIEPPKIKDSALTEMGFVSDNENPASNEPLSDKKAFIKSITDERLSAYKILNAEITEDKARALVKFYKGEIYYDNYILLHRQDKKWGIFWFGSKLSGIENWANFKNNDLKSAF